MLKLLEIIFMIRLTYNGVDLEKISGNILSSLQILYVLKGLKPCLRIFLNSERLPSLSEFCKNNNLNIEFSDYKIIPVVEKDKGDYSNRLRRIPKDRNEGLFYVYIGKSLNDVKTAKRFDKERNDVELGKALGYPDCCINSFKERKEEARKKNNDWTLFGSRSLAANTFFNNYSLRFFGISLINHFPCSLSCDYTRKIASDNLNLLKRVFPKVASFFEKELKAAVLYTENRGVFYSSDYRVEDRTVSLENIKGTAQNSLFDKLEAEKEIKVLSSGELAVGKEVIFKKEDSLFIFK